MQKSDVILHPEWVLTPKGLRRGTTVRVHAGVIIELADAARHPEVPVQRGTLLLPGFVNAHSHAFQRAFRGHVQWTSHPADDFWTWRDRMYAVARGLDPDGVEAVSALAFLEMAEAGFTTVGEFHYLHNQADGTPYADPDELARRVIRAARSVGLRIVLLRVVYAAGGFGRPLSDGQLRFRTRSPDEALQAVARLGSTGDPLVTAGLAPHSVRAVPVDWLPELRADVVHAHVSEQPAEVSACLEATGRTPLQVLADAGLVDDRFTAVHLTHPTDAELAIMRSSGARIAVCPTTELDLGDGFLPLAARDGIGLCVGSDSHARIDPFAEIRALELHARGLARRRIVMGEAGVQASLVERLLRAGTEEGGRALGLPVGRIEAGAPADLVLVDLDRTGAVGVPPLEAVVFGGSPEWVRDVWVAGEQVIRDGRHAHREAI
ncbi:MAG: formimidoylglutamate deiminase, partial [Myxococcales bacterium]|nr:formimidoylglutamate deiminase [Myxococcales bacterium]